MTRGPSPWDRRALSRRAEVALQLPARWGVARADEPGGSTRVASALSVEPQRSAWACRNELSSLTYIAASQGEPAADDLGAHALNSIREPVCRHSLPVEWDCAATVGTGGSDTMRSDTTHR